MWKSANMRHVSLYIYIYLETEGVKSSMPVVWITNVLGDVLLVRLDVVLDICALSVSTE